MRYQKIFLTQNQEKRAVLNTVLHLISYLIGNQTLYWKEQGGLLKYYAAVIQAHTPVMVKLSKYLVVDAYFAKKGFIDAVT